MPSYVFIASRDPESSSESTQIFDLAEGLARAEDTVTVYLTAGAVTTSHGRLAQLLEARVKVFADPDALEARGMKERALARGVVSVPFEALVAKWAA